MSIAAAFSQSYAEARRKFLAATEAAGLDVHSHIHPLLGRDGGHGLGPCMLHNPSYDFNDELIPLGGTMWVRLAEAWLAAPRAA